MCNVELQDHETVSGNCSSGSTELHRDLATIQLENGKAFHRRSVPKGKAFIPESVQRRSFHGKSFHRKSVPVDTMPLSRVVTMAFCVCGFRRPNILFGKHFELDTNKTLLHGPRERERERERERSPKFGLKISLTCGNFIGTFQLTNCLLDTFARTKSVQRRPVAAESYGFS